MKMKWFTRYGWWYAPTSIAACILYALAILFCITVFRAVDAHSHSVSDTLYGIFPFFGCTFLLLDWVARRTCEEA